MLDAMVRMKQPWISPRVALAHSLHKQFISVLCAAVPNPGVSNRTALYMIVALWNTSTRALILATTELLRYALGIVGSTSSSLCSFAVSVPPDETSVDFQSKDPGDTDVARIKIHVTVLSSRVRPLIQRYLCRRLPLRVCVQYTFTYNMVRRFFDAFSHKPRDEDDSRNLHLDLSPDLVVDRCVRVQLYTVPRAPRRMVQRSALEYYS